MELDFNKTYSGTEIVNYMTDISPDEENAQGYFASIARKREFKLQRLEIDKVLKMIENDLGAWEYIQHGTSRYYGTDFDGYYYADDDSPAPDVTEDSLYNPIVIVDTYLLDGYSRLSEHIHNTDHTDILAFVAI